MYGRSPFLLVLLLLFVALFDTGCADSFPDDPVTSDPPSVDDEYPPALVEAPSGLASHGHRLNGIFYLAAGRGPHPTAVLLHGLPGNERNLDLAHVLRRGGWNVAFVHYRGAWGSEGTFSFVNNVDDVARMVEFLRRESSQREYRIDADRIVLIGHSMGGGTALLAAARDPHIRGVVSIAGADLGRIGDLRDDERTGFAAYLETLLPLDISSGQALIDEVANAPFDAHPCGGRTQPAVSDRAIRRPLRLGATGRADESSGRGGGI